MPANRSKTLPSSKQKPPPRQLPHGKGSVYTRTSGQRQGEIVAVLPAAIHPSGKRKEFTLDESGEHFPDHEAAWKFLGDLLSDLDAGRDIDAGRIKVERFLADWLESNVKPYRSHGTYIRREKDVRLYINPHLGSALLSRLRSPEIQKFVGVLTTQHGLSPQSARLAFGTLHLALKLAKQWRYIDEDPSENIELPKVERAKPAFLVPADANRLREVLQESPHEALILAFLSLGLRRGEALGLRWADIDFPARSLRIRGNLQWVDHELKIIRPKTKSSRRDLVLPVELARILEAHRSRQALARRIAGDRWQENGLVFPREDGRPMPVAAPRRILQKILEDAGLPRITPHGLRHTYATLLLVHRLPDKSVQDALGHAGLSMTMHYTHVVDEMRHEVADTMDRLFGPPQKPP